MENIKDMEWATREVTKKWFNVYCPSVGRLQDGDYFNKAKEGRKRIFKFEYWRSIDEDVKYVDFKIKKAMMADVEEFGKIYRTNLFNSTRSFMCEVKWFSVEVL